MKALSTLLAILIASHALHAELHSALIHLDYSKATPRVASIYSDLKELQLKDVSVTDAATALNRPLLSKVSMSIIILSEKPIDAEDLTTLSKAIHGNITRGVSYIECGGLSERAKEYLQRFQAEQGAAANP